MEPPEEFPFPFEAYQIQKDFMRNLYSCMENGQLGIFESPTGTGKSLSIICGALRWLLDHEENEKQKIKETVGELDVKLEKIEQESKGDWFTKQINQIAVENDKRTLEAKFNDILKFEEKKVKMKQLLRDKQAEKFEKPKFFAKKKKDEVENESKDEKEKIQDEDLVIVDIDGNSETFDDDDDESEEAYRNTKIIFCSRTHTQLAQFIGELKRSIYADKISVVPLASRQNYCINKEVKRLKNANMINERCLELQRKKTTVKKEKALKKSKTTTSCPYMPGSQDLLVAKVLTEIQDVEEITNESKGLETCGYYASRQSVKDGQVILVPYNSILHKNTREGSGLSVKNNILIIDEAHNLLDAIERMHNAEITARNVMHCFNQLSQYHKRFQDLFSAKNTLYLTQLSFILKKFLMVLGGNTKTNLEDKINVQSKIYTTVDFEVQAEIDTINVFELLSFIKNSKLIHKLRGYADKFQGSVQIHKVETKKLGVSEFLNTLKPTAKVDKKVVVQEVVVEQRPKDTNEDTSCPLIVINNFLECLKAQDEDGRVFIIAGATFGQGSLKFQLLNPASKFTEIVQDARAVILAGGTMEPISEFRDQLFIGAGALPERIVTFSCSHVVPQENILTTIVQQGPMGVEFLFNFKNRSNKKLLDELCRTLVNICNIVPAGIVVFLPSYEYEKIVYNHLESSGVLAKIKLKKRIFREPKHAAQVAQVLDDFAESIKHPQQPQNGSLLFSVVGGKLSEGLNFSDDLGRCVIVVGMPYPNIMAPEIKEKMSYLNANVNKNAGNEFYENCCMKAVNQCIGRAVRHINDYAVVLLFDKRYANKTKSLPGWIQRTLTISTNFGSAIAGTAKFFAAKRKLKTSS